MLSIILRQLKQQEFQDLHVKMRLAFLWVALNLCFNNSVLAQDPSSFQLSKNNFLPSDRVYQIIQDKQNFIWMATDEGVVQLDGIKSKYFSSENGLPDNDIIKIFEDSQGKIWFLPYNGKLSYYQNGKIFSWKNDSLLATCKNTSAVMGYFESSDCTVYFRTLNGIIIVKKNQIIEYPEEFPINASGELFWEKNDSIFTFSSNPNLLSTPQNEVFLKSPPLEFLNNPLSNRLIKIGSSDFLFAHSNSLKKIHGDSVQTIFTFANGLLNRINFLYSKDSSKIWIGDASEGLFCYDINSNEVYRFFQGKSTSSVLIDHENNLWVSNLFEGVSLIRNTSVFSLTKGEEIKNERIVSISKTQSNQIVFSTPNEAILISNNRISKLISEIETKSVDLPTRFFKLSNGNVFYWNRHGQAILSEKGSKKLSPDQYFDMVDYKWVTETHDGFVLCGGSDGLFYADSRNNKHYVVRSSKFESRVKTISGIFKNKNEIWIGTTNGLFVFSVDDSSCYKKNHLFQTSKITAIKKLPNETVCIGTDNLGLLIEYQESFFSFSKEHGLPSNSIREVIIDKRGEIWAGTNKGVSRIQYNEREPEKSIITNYSTYDGLVSDDITCLYMDEDTLYVGTTGGLTWFDINKIKLPPVAPLVYIARFEVGGMDTALLDQYVLPYSLNDVGIEFRGISYRSLGAVTYKYMLESIDQDWKYTSQNQIQFGSLPPGNYVFKVFSRSRDGVWSEKPATVAFIILPPWWATWWFRALVFLVLAGILALIVYNRIRNIRERAEIQKRISELRIQALGLQMNPHFIFNSLNSVHHFISRDEKNNARSYLAQFGKLVRGILEHSTEEKVSLSEEIRLLDLYIGMEKLRMGDKLTYEISVDEKLQPEELFIPPMLVQPFVENCIWHGLSHLQGEGVLMIRFENGQTHVHVTITDNGVGRKTASSYSKERKTKSISTKSIKERLYLLNRERGIPGDVTITDLKNDAGDPTGTQIEMWIPFIEEF